jgi:hypothetical protein
VSDPKAAAFALAQGAKAGLDGQPTLAVLFSTTDYDTNTLVATVQAELGDVPIWGGSSSTGVFANGHWVTGEKGAAALMLIANRPAGASTACVDGDPIAAGKAATEAAVKQAGGQAGVLLTLGFMGDEEKVLAGAAQIAPGVPVVGGSASDHKPESKFMQFGDGKAQMGAFAIAAIGGQVGTAFTHGYKLTGQRATVTKFVGRRIIELNSRPALDVYAEWVGKPKDELYGSAILLFSVLHPLLLHKNGITLSIHPVGGNQDGSIDTGMAMQNGYLIELGDSTPDELIAEVQTAVRQAAANIRYPEAVILSHCGGRAIALGDRIAEVADQVYAATGGVPWIGYLAFGEQGSPLPGTPEHANLSLSVLVLGSN